MSIHRYKKVKSMTERGKRNLWTSLSRKIRIVPGEDWESQTRGNAPGRKKKKWIVCCTGLCLFVCLKCLTIQVVLPQLLSFNIS